MFYFYLLMIINVLLQLLRDFISFFSFFWYTEGIYRSVIIDKFTTMFILGFYTGYKSKPALTTSGVILGSGIRELFHRAQ